MVTLYAAWNAQVPSQQTHVGLHVFGVDPDQCPPGTYRLVPWLRLSNIALPMQPSSSCRACITGSRALDGFSTTTQPVEALLLHFCFGAG